LSDTTHRRRDDPTLARLRAAVELTRLNFGLTSTEVVQLVQAAERLDARGICVPASFVPVAVAALRPAAAFPMDIVTVANFPTGDQPVAFVERMTVESVRAGANHVDLVVPGAFVAERDWPAVTGFCRRVREAIHAAADRPVALKVILETAAWDAVRIRGAAHAAIDAGAEWLKTSTGFHPAGGATAAVVEALREMTPPGVGIKASGGIRTRETALEMLQAGADRIGTSSLAILDPKERSE
jgi:deoxyribose-phosphate aldolase